jgi:hypothetical protein
MVKLPALVSLEALLSMIDKSEHILIKQFLGPLVCSRTVVMLVYYFGGRCITRYLMRCLMVLFCLLPAFAEPQELSAEDRACITAATGKLPTIAALEIKGSRKLARSGPERRNQKLHHAIVEIDVTVAGHSSTYIFNCISDAGLVVIQPMGMR